MSMLHSGRPRLIVLEGIDLSGRTTQVQLLRDWLTAQHYSVTTTSWRTSPLISDILARARLGPPLRPLTYSLLFSADALDRTQQVIRPALKRGEIVLADRYVYTAIARDTARGLDANWLRSLYRFAVPPDAVFYLHISPEEAVKRRYILQQERLRQSAPAPKKGPPAEKQKQGKSVKDKEKHKKEKKGKKHKNEEVSALVPSTDTLATPLPMGPDAAPLAIPLSSSVYSKETLESFRDFEIKMYNEYQNMQKEFGFAMIEGSQTIEQVQTLLRRAIMQLLAES